MNSDQAQSGLSNKQFNSDDTLIVGEYIHHKRQLEAFFTICHVLICPTYLMFGDNKGHLVDQMDKSTKDLRTKMDSAAIEGLLQFEKTEAVLVDIQI